MKFIIKGELKSKANSRRVTRNGLIIKSKAALEFMEYAVLQLQQQYKGEPIEYKVYLDLVIYYPNRRSDLSPELFFDCLQKAGVLKNDRQIYGYVAIKELDKENPRVECTLYKHEN